jgi:hypothetical protein
LLLTVEELGATEAPADRPVREVVLGIEEATAQGPTKLHDTPTTTRS